MTTAERNPFRWVVFAPEPDEGDLHGFASLEGLRRGQHHVHPSLHLCDALDAMVEPCDEGDEMTWWRWEASVTPTWDAAAITRRGGGRTGGLGFRAAAQAEAERAIRAMIAEVFAQSPEPAQTVPASPWPCKAERVPS